jgi:hypothetical protein
MTLINCAFFRRAKKEGKITTKLAAKFLLLPLLFAFACLGAYAQENAELTGSVTDATGAVIPKAKVTITNIGTGEARSAASNGAGLYDFSGLNHGTYNLKVEAQGFKVYQKTGIVVDVAATVPENIVLEIGTSNQTVEVKADALHLQTETNEISTLISGQQLTQLATNGRNMVSLATLGTGVSNNLPSFNGVTAQGSAFGLSFNGMRPDHNDWLIDGGEAYDRGSGGKFDLMPTMDAIAEFQTLTSNYSPDYGISSGGTITMVLKSGTNQYHGSAWEFDRNDDFDANSYFSKQSGTPPPELRLNIFGFGVGGPAFIPGIYPKSKSKTYFYESEEWRRFIDGSSPSVIDTIPDADFPTAGQALQYVPWNDGTTPPIVPTAAQVGDSAITNNYPSTWIPGQPIPVNSNGTITIPANLLDPNAVLFMGTGAIPHATGGTGTSNNPQNVQSVNQPIFVREDVVRVDHDISEKYHLMGHWIHDQMSQTIFPSEWGPGNNYPTAGTLFANPSWAAVIKLSQTLRPNLLNETALDVNGNTITWSPLGIYQQPSGWTGQPLTGFNGNSSLNELPALSFSGSLGTNYDLNYDPWHNAFLDYQIRDDLSWNKGRHDMKFGFGYMRMDKNQQQQSLVQGTYNFESDFTGDSYLNFLLGLSDQFTQLQQMTTPHWINNTFSFYGMDNWHLMPRLTLNLGVRWDLLPHVFEKNNRVSNFDPALFNPTDAQVPNLATGSLNPTGPGVQTINGVPFYMNGIAEAGQNGTPRGLVNNDYETIQPRIGLAYDMFGRGKTILRMGGGLFYERVQGNDMYGLDVNAPFAVNAQVNGIDFTNPNVSLATGGQAAQPLNPSSPGSLNPHYPDPGTAQFSVGIQQQLQPAVMAVVQYVGSIGWDQNNELAINTLPDAALADRQLVGENSDLSNQYRIFSGYGGITQTESATNTNYNSLQAGLRVENKYGLTTQFSYTWSHEIDIASGDEGSTNFAGGSSTVSDPFNLHYDRGSGVLDRRHIFSVNYDYHLPFYNRSGNGLLRNTLGGWEISGVTTAEAGSPAQVYFTGLDQNGNAIIDPNTNLKISDMTGLGGGTTNRPNVSGSTKGPKTQAAWFQKSAFTAPTVAPWNGGPNDGFGDAGKDAAVGPGLFNWNMALFKSFALTSHEGPRFELRCETFNTFNHTEFNGLDLTLSDKNFGSTTSTMDPRELQFGGKFIF